jgi:8-oxo-dGTP diphosphatase
MVKPVTPLLTVDIIILFEKRLVLIQRMNPPYRGHWALPGGFVDVGETVEHAATREAKEETGLDVELKELVGVFSDPDRDPRGHTVSVCFIATGHGSLEASSDARGAALFDPDEDDLPPLAFDHEQIIHEAIEQISVILQEQS